MDDVIIAVKEITTGYSADKILLRRASFNVRRGEICTLLGGSGCGKSTLLKNLIGLYEPLEGEILINGNNIAGADREAKLEIVKKFGVTYQGGALFGSMTIAENVALPLQVHTKMTAEEIDKTVKEKLALVGLSGFEEYFPSEISGGMCKRAGLARALALNPELLFFDEPSAGLDPVTSAGLDRLILNLRDTLGATVVLVTHELDSIFSIADHAVMLDKATKSIIADGSPADLLEHSNPEVRKFLNRDGMKKKAR